MEAASEEGAAREETAATEAHQSLLADLEGLREESVKLEEQLEACQLDRANLEAQPCMEYI